MTYTDANAAANFTGWRFHPADPPRMDPDRETRPTLTYGDALDVTVYVDTSDTTGRPRLRVSVGIDETLDDGGPDADVPVRVDLPGGTVYDTEGIRPDDAPPVDRAAMIAVAARVLDMADVALDDDSDAVRIVDAILALGSPAVSS